MSRRLLALAALPLLAAGCGASPTLLAGAPDCPSAVGATRVLELRGATACTLDRHVRPGSVTNEQVEDDLVVVLLVPRSSTDEPRVEAESTALFARDQGWLLLARSDEGPAPFPDAEVEVDVPDHQAGVWFDLGTVEVRDRTWRGRALGVVRDGAPAGLAVWARVDAHDDVDAVLDLATTLRITEP